MALCAVVPALADTKLAARYVADGQVTETVIYARGERAAEFLGFKDRHGALAGVAELRRLGSRVIGALNPHN